MERVSDGKYSTTQNSEHKDSLELKTAMENRRSVKVSKRAEGLKSENKRNETKET